jgi:hypothetical protein
MHICIDSAYMLEISRAGRYWPRYLAWLEYLPTYIFCQGTESARSLYGVNIEFSLCRLTSQSMLLYFEPNAVTKIVQALFMSPLIDARFYTCC